MRRSRVLRTCDIRVPIHARQGPPLSGRVNVDGTIDDEHWENLAPRLDETPRRLAPRSFVAHCEREPGRLQLRLVLARDEHVDDIVVDEEEDCVTAFASICSPTTGAHPKQMEGPFHVYLERPLGERKVIDALSGRRLPYRNVWAELAEEEEFNGAEPSDDG